MKKLIFALLLIPIVLLSQDKPVAGSRGQVATATTTTAAFYLGGGFWKDVTVINLGTGTDTLIIYPSRLDSTASLWRNRVLVLTGWVNNKLTRFPGDSIWVRASANTIKFYYEATVR